MYLSFNRSRFLRPLAGLLTAGAMTLSLSGCAQRADGSLVTAIDDVQVMSMSAEGLSPPAARQLERAQRYAEMRLTGAAAGAVLGALAGALAIKDNRAAGAAGGAALGAALGYLGGAYIANMNSQAEDRRTDLNVQLAAARSAVNEADQDVQDAKAMVKAQERSLRNTVAAYQRGEVAKDQAEARVEDANRHLVLIDEAIRRTQDNIQGISVTIDDNKSNNRSSRGLQSRISELQRREAQLVSQKQRLVQAFQGVPSELGAPATS